MTISERSYVYHLSHRFLTMIRQPELRVLKLYEMIVCVSLLVCLVDVIGIEMRIQVCRSTLIWLTDLHHCRHSTIPEMKGLKHKTTGRLYYHTSTQAQSAKSNVEAFSRDTQTVLQKNHSIQTTAVKKTQGTRKWLFMDDANDVIVFPSQVLCARNLFYNICV